MLSVRPTESVAAAHLNPRWWSLLTYVLVGVLAVTGQLPTATGADAPDPTDKLLRAAKKGTVARPVRNVFDVDTLGVLLKQARLEAPLSTDAAAKERRYRLPLMVEGDRFVMEFSIHRVEPKRSDRKDERVFVLINLPVGFARQPGLIADAKTIRPDRGSSIEAVQWIATDAGILYLSLLTEAFAYTDPLEDIRDARDAVAKKLAAEMDEEAKKPLARQLAELTFRANLDIELRLKPDLLAAQVAALVDHMRLVPHLFDTSYWARTEPQTTVGKAKVENGVVVQPTFAEAKRVDWPGREADRYHPFYESQRRNDLLSPTGIIYDRSVGQTEKWRGKIPVQTGLRVEASPEFGRVSERSTLNNWLHRTELLSPSGYYYNSLIADNTKFRAKTQITPPKHYYHDLDTNVPVKLFEPKLWQRYPRYYTGTAGDYRDARFYDGNQKRPIWLGH